jgi:sec-independent protein translocase protein TatA
MPPIQPIHLILVLIIALVIFGPSRLPQLGRSLGESITEFKHATKEMTESLKEATEGAAAQPTQSVAARPTAAGAAEVSPLPGAANGSEG